MSCVEAHGTGTALGDPTEAGALAAVHGPGLGRWLSGPPRAAWATARRRRARLGCSRCRELLQDATAGANAQLRVLNPLVAERLRGLEAPFVLPQQGGRTRLGGASGASGVSSFGYSGTITHAVLRGFLHATIGLPSLGFAPNFRRNVILSEDGHPFVQASVPSPSAGALLFRSPAAGRLHALVADHVVQSRVIFPGTGYLEMARAATNTVAPHWLRGVFFLQPLVLDVVGLHVECLVSSGGGWEVRSGEVSSAASLLDATVHCSGEAFSVRTLRLHREPGELPQHTANLAVVRSRRCSRASDVPALYGHLRSSGLEYGPGFRNLSFAWRGDGGTAAGFLRARPNRGGTLVHPADLDDALCLTALTPAGGGGGTRLPFAVDDARLRSAAGRMWSVATPQSADASFVCLGASGTELHAVADGYKSRALRASQPALKDLYSTSWADTPPKPHDSSMPCIMLAGSGPGIPEGSTAATQRSARVSPLVAAAVSSRGTVPLAVLESAFSLVQTRAASEVPPSPLILLSKGGKASRCDASSTRHAGAWGLARVARSEAQLPLLCHHAPARLELECRIETGEPERLARAGQWVAPRLSATALPAAGDRVRLHFHSRGAISNLFVEAQPPLNPLPDHTLRLHTRAVGLNFRDVLNILGQYPGTPGPPGNDASGVVVEVGRNVSQTVGMHTFGFSFAPLATLGGPALSILMAPKPKALSFEQACTLPSTWLTVHVALGRSGLSGGERILVQAAAGGVGLKACEYSRWLSCSSVGTAGRPQKHRFLALAGVGRACSSRDGAAFTIGVSRLGRRLHEAINSLSYDFISGGMAALGQGRTVYRDREARRVVG